LAPSNHAGSEFYSPAWPRDYAARISRITYIGHSTLLVEVSGTRVLTDPLLRQRILHIRRRVPPPAVEDLHSLNAILISHPHHDHLDPPSLRMVAGDFPVIAPRGCRWTVRRGGATRVIEVEAGDRVGVGGVTVEAVAALHDGRRFPIGRQRPALGYLLEGPPSVYFAGDTDLFPEMEALAGRVDVAALPIWGWGPRVPAGHLDPERAARAAAMIQPRIAIPIHWGTMTTGSIEGGVDFAPAREFTEAAAKVAPGVEVRALAPGEMLDL
jgi:L-ascorbate metabolism protein UlaG (beta-lactamase superfamily)